MSSRRAYCPHCNRYVTHRKPCSKFSQATQDKYEEALKLRKVQEEERRKEQVRLDAEIEQVKQQFPKVWAFVENKFAEYENQVEEALMRTRSRNGSMDFTPPNY